ncbi:MAG: hypothetical protein GW900_01170 [Gammaproteobacteria bacterium]|nr:hypothetical protein [Gammaproteobacteria bacterium]
MRSIFDFVKQTGQFGLNLLVAGVECSLREDVLQTVIEILIGKCDIRLLLDRRLREIEIRQIHREIRTFVADQILQTANFTTFFGRIRGCILGDNFPPKRPDPNDQKSTEPEFHEAAFPYAE